MHPMIQQLKAATFEVLEIMFFLFPEPMETEARKFSGEGFRAWVEVQGPETWQLGLTAPQPLARLMAANFLGIPQEEISSEGLQDVLKETVNMMAGGFVTGMAWPEKYTLKVPQSRPLELSGPDWAPDSHRLLLQVEDLGLELFLREAGGDAGAGGTSGQTRGASGEN